MQRMISTLVCSTTIAAVVYPALHAAGQTITASFDGPSLDRWMYPFNPSPGSRTTASTFGAFTQDPQAFDNRDGQILLAFETAAQVTAGLGPSAYTIQSATLVMQNSNDNVYIYDPTQDSYTAFLASDDPQYIPDADPGQSLELFGAGYRGGFSTFSFMEDSEFGFGDPTAPSVRNAYALGFDASGNAVDVSNSVRQRWNPTPFAVGQIASLSPGDFVPVATDITFELNVSDPDIAGYLQAALNLGKLDFCLTSHTFVEPMGGDFPSFFLRENSRVVDGIVNAAQLTLVVDIDDSAGCPADITGSDSSTPDGVVNLFDLLQLIDNWGANAAGAAISADGGGSDVVDLFDLLGMLDAWGNCM